MEFEDKIFEVIKERPSKFPLGYQFLCSRKVEKINGRIGFSKIHNSYYYVLTDFYKPTSNIFFDDQE